MRSPILAVLLGVLVSSPAWAGKEDRELRREERRAAPPTVRDIEFHEDQLFAQEFLRRGPHSPPPRVPVIHYLQRSDIFGRGTNNNLVRVSMEQDEDGVLAHVFPFRAFIDRVPLDTEVLEQDAWRVELWYAHHGWFDAEVTAWEVREVRPAPRLPGLRPRRLRGPVVDVIAHVELGPESLITLVEIDGIDHVSPAAMGTVRRAKDDMEGARFDIDAPYDMADIVRNQLLENGYARAATSVNVVARPDDHELEVFVQAEAGEICMFGEVEIVGNVDVRAEDIERRVPITPGERFDPRRLEETQRNLFGLGTFSVVQIEPQLEVEGQVIPIKITVTETRFRELKAGGGFALQRDQGQIRGVGRFGHNNLFGRLIRFEGEAIGGWKTFRSDTTVLDNTMGETTDEIVQDVISGGPFVEATGSLLYPNIFGTQWSHTPQLGFEFNRFPSYQVRDVSMSPRFTYAFTKNLAVTPGYRWNYRKEQLEAGAALTADELGALNIDPSNPEVEYHIHKMVVTGAWDTRRPLLQPSRGHYAEVTVAQAGAWLPGRTFAEARLDVRKYQTLVLRDFRPVIAVRGVGGVIEPFGDDPARREIPLTERYYLGGGTSLRGFGEDLVGPRGCSAADPGNADRVVSVPCTDPSLYADADGNETEIPGTDVDIYPLGGNVVAYYSVEARIPVGADYDVVLFHDNGALWAERSDVAWGAFSPTVGIGGRIATPAGPLRVDVAYRLRDDEAYQLDRRVAFYIALQEAF
ncbi:MAG: BamA/TamA family outer membrane protein [Proteobacteria bacterium]|nr:BamA/TamA family outer membrane protein [Pseudomonadota bacterium]MCP4919560.1 BamA/TamA family outer membrane protein [Pseudomonadota bacterium]